MPIGVFGCSTWSRSAPFVRSGSDFHAFRITMNDRECMTKTQLDVWIINEIRLIDFTKVLNDWITKVNSTPWLQMSASIYVYATHFRIEQLLLVSLLHLTLYTMFFKIPNSHSSSGELSYVHLYPQAALSLLLVPMLTFSPKSLPPGSARLVQP